MGEVLELAERAWSGALEGSPVQPGAPPAFEVLRPGLAFLAAFSNVAVLETADGLVLLDTSSVLHARRLFDAVRGWSARRVDTAVYSHGHVDHVFGLGPFDEEARVRGWPAPRVLAHERCPARFERYALTQGWNARINQRQFGFPRPIFPTAFRRPDATVGSGLDLDVGGVRVELRHDLGETDDHLWAWIPAHRALYTGDLFIWASPNCGNPQKVQRYPREWAHALRRMQTLDAEWLLPGHGPPIVGAARVRAALGDTAELLETLCEQTLRLMNEGARLDDVLHGVAIPAHLLERPYLRPSYDDPRFVVRNLWRLYGGWWDGNPAQLLPAREADLAGELAALAGGAEALAARAERLAADERLDLACHLVELAARAAPADAKIHAVRAAVYRERARRESSLMAKGIFRAAARESEERA